MVEAQRASRASMVYLSGWFVREKGPTYSFAYLDTNASFARPNLLTRSASSLGICDTVLLPEDKRVFPGASGLLAQGKTESGYNSYIVWPFHSCVLCCVDMCVNRLMGTVRTAQNWFEGALSSLPQTPVLLR